MVHLGKGRRRACLHACFIGAPAGRRLSLPPLAARLICRRPRRLLHTGRCDARAFTPPPERQRETEGGSLTRHVGQYTRNSSSRKEAVVDQIGALKTAVWELPGGRSRQRMKDVLW